MTFEEHAYAEGICNTAAGSEIEVFVDTIDETLRAIEEGMASHSGAIVGLPKYAEEDAEHAAIVEAWDELRTRWSDLRSAIVDRERGENTSFGEAP